MSDFQARRESERMVERMAPRDLCEEGLVSQMYRLIRMGRKAYRAASRKNIAFDESRTSRVKPDRGRPDGFPSSIVVFIGRSAKAAGGGA